MKISEIIEPSVVEINASVQGKKIRRPSKLDRMIRQIEREESQPTGVPPKKRKLLDYRKYDVDSKFDKMGMCSIVCSSTNFWSQQEMKWMEWGCYAG